MVRKFCGWDESSAGFVEQRREENDPDKRAIPKIKDYPKQENRQKPNAEQKTFEKLAQIKLELDRPCTKRTNRYETGDGVDDVSKMISELRTKNNTLTAAANAADKIKADDAPDASSAPSHHENTVESKKQLFRQHLEKP